MWVSIRLSFTTDRRRYWASKLIIGIFVFTTQQTCTLLRLEELVAKKRAERAHCSSRTLPLYICCTYYTYRLWALKSHVIDIWSWLSNYLFGILLSKIFYCEKNSIFAIVFFTDYRWVNFNCRFSTYASSTTDIPGPIQYCFLSWRRRKCILVSLQLLCFITTFQLPLPATITLTTWQPFPKILGCRNFRRYESLSHKHHIHWQS